MTELRASSSIFVNVSPHKLYALVSDVTRTGEWSPTCRACWWDPGAGPEVGSWFTGRNQTADHTWEARCRVVAADLGRAFAWEVYEGKARWEYTFEPDKGGTQLTETWEFLPAGVAWFREQFDAQADTEAEKRCAAAKDGITATLTAIKEIAETMD